MSLLMQSHGGATRVAKPTARNTAITESLVPAAADASVDEAADFGYFMPPSGNPSDYLPNDCAGELDTLGSLMVPAEETPPDVAATPDSTLPAIMTYWGQFLDHELTARTDRETVISHLDPGAPIFSAADIETTLKNARTPRFDLDSVYGGVPVGAGAAEGLSTEVATVISGMRHPTLTAKMRVGTAGPDGPLPDGLDPHRDLPRFGQVQQSVRDAYLAIAQQRLSPADFADFQAKLPKRAIIGDMRNDENLVVAQFHLSFLRFHNRVVDFLTENDTGWIADFNSAKTLTTLHYQWLAIEGYLKSVCDPVIVNAVLASRAKHFFDFRAAYNDRVGNSTLGDVIPLEFSVAAFRFGHTMVRNLYDYNKNFGRPGGIIPNAPFNLLFAFTGGGGLGAAAGIPSDRLPENWVIDWSRFVTTDTSFADGGPQRAARSLDTLLAPPLGDMLNEGGEFDETDPAQARLKELFRHLARRNLRRGLSLRLPTGQALHAHLKSIGALASNPVADVTTLLDNKPDMAAFLHASDAKLHERTPLWFYCLAEAEAAGGNRLGDVGSWIVASTFIAVMLDDPDSALSTSFTPDMSPLRGTDGTPIDTIEKWLKFALVLE